MTKLLLSPLLLLPNHIMPFPHTYYASFWSLVNPQEELTCVLGCSSFGLDLGPVGPLLYCIPSQQSGTGPPPHTLHHCLSLILLCSSYPFIKPQIFHYPLSLLFLFS